MVVKFYTDGACSGNPGPGGFASIVINLYGDVEKTISGGKELTTNNEMELMAILKSLQFVIKHGLNKGKHRAEIYTDSAYVVNSINQKWYINWANNGWRTKQGKEVANKEIWQEIHRLMKLVNAKIIKVKGHDGDYYNELADKAAKAEIVNAK